MQLTQKKTLYIAVSCALIAVLMTASYLASKKRELLEWSEQITVLVATRDILENSEIDEEMVREEYVPKKFVQPGALTKLQFAVGRVTVAPVRKNEQVTDTKLVNAGRNGGLAVKIAPGKRAVSVAVDEISGVSGLIRPNNFVDVLATFDFGGEASAKTYTYTILEDVLVIAVGDDLGAGNVNALAKREENGMFGGTSSLGSLNESMKKRTVTLAVTPADVQKLVLAQESSAITLSLRPQWEDPAPQSLEPATPTSVTGLHELLKARGRPVYREYRGR